uniref:Uncharacterized protein n=1 Tax=Lactuca sativa TaxID=4236 RepID=A0A9R1WI57_LACSA|nr:hypothetical protein LSAT_V11C100034070 [Lactuca sativa]
MIMKLLMHLNAIRLKSKINLKDTSKLFARTEADNISTHSLTHCVKRIESNMREFHHILPNIMVWMKERTEPFVRWSTAYRLLDNESCVVVESIGVEFFEDKFPRDEENSSHTTPTSTSREILPPPPIVEEPRRSTRARIEKRTQKKLTREVIFAINLDDDPKTFTEAMTFRDVPLWKEAIKDEIDSIIGNGTWELAYLHKGRRPMGSKWIFKRWIHIHL